MASPFDLHRNISSEIVFCKIRALRKVTAFSSFSDIPDVGANEDGLRSELIIHKPFPVEHNTQQFAYLPPECCCCLPATHSKEARKSFDSKSRPQQIASSFCLRFGSCDIERSQAIRDFIRRFFCDFFAESVVRVAIFNLRFENAASWDCDALGR